MFGKKINVNQVDTIVGAGTEFEGTIKATGMVRIDGKTKGELNTEGDIIIGELGEVNADIRGRNITIAGKVKGNVCAKERLQLLPTAFLTGDVEVKTIIIEEGAKFVGNCKMEEAVQEGKHKKRDSSK